MNAPNLVALQPVYPLEQGDHLTREEFERRYEAMPRLKKAELIEGIVFMASPVSFKYHGEGHFNIIGWTFNYKAATPGVEAGDNATVRLDDENEPQPDVALLIPAELGGQSRIDEAGYVEGAPELVVEVAASSSSYDLHSKLRVYESHGVREYLVWRVRDEAIDWFVRRGDRFEKLAPGADGVYRSEVFPGLWLDVPRLLKGDLAGVLQVLQQGLASSEHAAFAARLAKKA